MDKTMTAEEVEKAKEQVRQAFEWSVEWKDVAGPVCSLAAQAERVPGLVEELRGAVENFDKAASAAAGSAKAHGEEIKRRKQAESERDAARKEAKDLAALLDVLRAALACTDDSQIPEDVERLQSSASSLRERVATLEAERDAEKMAREHLEREREMWRTAEARVTELEDDLANAREDVATNQKIIAEEVERRMAAQARVKELEAEVATLKEREAKLEKDLDEEMEEKDEAMDLIADVAMQLGCEDEWSNAHDHRQCLPEFAAQALASQPPPAPAQGELCSSTHEHPVGSWLMCDVKGPHEKHGGTEPGGRRVTWRDPPTPPPGLREAVGKVLETWGATFDDEPERRESAMDALRAAYDATGGEDWGTKMQDDLRVVLTLATTGNLGTTQTPLGQRAVNAVQALREDAAKYRAAVERLGDKFGLGKATASADGYDSPAREGAIIEDYYRRGLAGARWALGLTLDTPPSGPGGGCKAHPGQQCDPETPGVYECRAVPASGRLLAAKPIHTSGPEGGEGADAEARVSACGFKPESPEDEAAFAEVMQATARRMQSHARIAPTPTPEPGEIRLPAADFDRVAMDAFGLKSQPTAPGVVWEGEETRALSDGSVEWFDTSEGAWRTTQSNAARDLARALAEAKREVAEMRKAHDAVQYAAKNEAWATAGGDVLAIHAKRLEKDTADTAKQAAESMRERAEELAYAAAAKMTDETSRDVLLAIGSRIGDLPLE